MKKKALTRAGAVLLAGVMLATSAGTAFIAASQGTDGVKRMYVYDNGTDELLTVYTAAEDYTYNAETGVWETTATNTANSKEASVKKVWEDADETDLPDDTYMTLWAWTDTAGTGEPPVDDISQWTQVDISGSTAAHYTSTSTISGTVTDTAVELNSANDWSATLKNLPKYDTSGTTKHEIYYMFREAQAGDTIVVNGTLMTLEDDWLTDYEASYSGGGTTLLTTVTNTLTGGTGHITVSKKILASDLEKLEAFDTVPTFTFTLSWVQTGDDGNGGTVTLRNEDSVTLVFATEADYADKAQTDVTYAYLADDAEADEEGYLTVSYIWEELAYNTYTVTESGGDAWYELADIQAGLAQSIDLEAKSAVFTIDSGSKDYEFEAVFTNTLRTGELSIHKEDGKGNAMSGVEFVLYTASGKAYKSGTTDSDGNLTFTDIAVGTYELRETAGTSGSSMLAEPIEVTMPLVLTEAQVAAYALQGITVNTDDAVNADGSWYFYSLSYTVTNTANLDMPFTGTAGRTLLFAALAAVLLLIIGAAAAVKSGKLRRKARKPQA